jgi:hypothetical protein
VISLFPSCGYREMKNDEENVYKSWSHVESFLHKRIDIIPALVDFVNNSMPDERKTMDDIILSRSKTVMSTFPINDLCNMNVMKSFETNQNELANKLEILLSIVEKNQGLNKNIDFKRVLDILLGNEKKIADACDQYNSATQKFNKSIHKFPSNLVNRLFLRKKEIKEIHFDTIGR